MRKFSEDEEREFLERERRQEKYGERPEPDGPTDAWCRDCKETVRLKTVDMGVGPIEYHGRREYHRDRQIVCSKCEGQKLDEYPPEDEETPDAPA